MRYQIAEDVANVIISARRSGTTWLEALLGAYLCSAYRLPEEDLMRAEKLTREAGLAITAFTHDPQRLEAGGPAPEEEYAGKRVVLLLRHPCDTLVSQYMLFRYRHKTVKDSVSLDDYARAELPRLLGFYAAWLSCDRAKLAGFTTLAYEALVSDTGGELARLAAFCGYRQSQLARVTAVVFASFDNMKMMEREGLFHEYYRVNDFLPRDDERALRTRDGKIGGRAALSPETLAWMEMQIARTALAAFYAPESAYG